MEVFKFHIFGILLCIVTLFSTVDFFPPVDVSDDRIYSLSEGSKNILREIKSPLLVSYYAPFTHPDLSADLNYHLRRIRLLLQQYKRDAPEGMVNLRLVDSYQDAEVLMMAKRAGLQAHETDLGPFVWGLTLNYRGKVGLIEAFNVKSQGFVEFDISEAILGLSLEQKPRLYLISAISLLGQHQDPRFKRQRDWMLIRSLRKAFDVFEHDIASSEIPEDADLIMTLGEDGISSELWHSVVTFVRNGGPAMIIADPFCRVCSVEIIEEKAGRNKLTLPKILDKWGVGYDRDLMVGDINRSTRVQSVGKAVDYPFFMQLNSLDLSSKFKITSHLENIYYAEGGFFDLSRIGQGSLEAIPLMHSGVSSGHVRAGLANLRSTHELASALKEQGEKKVLAALLIGYFSDVIVGDEDAKLPEKSSVFLLGDIDMLHDRNTISKVSSGTRTFLKAKNDNIALVENTALLLAGNENLVAIRNHTRVFHNIDKIQQMKQQAKDNFDIESKSLKWDLDQLRQQLEELGSMSHDRLQAREIQDSLASLREEEILVAGKLMSLQVDAKRDLESFLFWFEFSHIVLIPLLLIILASGFSQLQRRRLAAFIPQGRGQDRRRSDRRA